MSAGKQRSLMHRVFAAIVRHPLIVALCGLAAILFFGLHAVELRKDTRAEAFHPPGHPAVVDRDRLNDLFGLKEPVIIAVHRPASGGVFTAETLRLVHELTLKLGRIPGIDPERVTSLATEKSIAGDDLGLNVRRFVPAPPGSPEEAAAVQNAVHATPSIINRLVSSDGQVTLVVAELLTQADAEQVYWDVLSLVEATPLNDPTSLHVAGAGAMLGYLGIYMDRDAMTLAPVAALLVLLCLFLAHRSAIGMFVSTLVIVGSVALTLGSMALLGARFYVITNALPVILIGIAVDDALHIFGEYRRRLTQAEEGPQRDLVVQTMLAMSRPVTVTTLTTAAGCLALGFSSAIPPMREFGLFAALGIAFAWLFSLTLVPAVLALWQRHAVRSGKVQVGCRPLGGPVRRAADFLPRIVFALPRSIVVIAAIWLTLGAFAAMGLRVDEANIDNFQAEEPIVVADSLINAHGIGTNYVDIMIEGHGEDDLLRPPVLQYVDSLQSYAERIPGVLQTVSYLDSLKQIDKALQEPGEESMPVLGSEEMAAQYLLLYSMSGDPADFRTLVDNGYQRANLRLHLDSGWYRDETKILAALEGYLAENRPPEGIAATLSGTAVVHVSWVGMLFDGHLLSIALSLLAVWLIATLSFRSPLRGSLVLVPVIFALLTVYAAMALLGINLAVGTSMTAAIAIGLSVDFGVHLLHRIDAHCRRGLASLKAAVGAGIEDSGRAIFFGFLTGFVGFGVLALSEVPGVARFGGLVAISLAASFLASLCLLPALILSLKALGRSLQASARPAASSNSDLHSRKAGEEICSSVKPSALQS